MGGRHAAIERHNHEDIDAWQQCLDNGKPRYRRFVEHRCGTTPATQLRAHFPFECAILNANRTAAQSPNFPGGFFTH